MQLEDVDVLWADAGLVIGAESRQPRGLEAQQVGAVVQGQRVGGHGRAGEADGGGRGGEQQRGGAIGVGREVKQVDGRGHHAGFQVGLGGEGVAEHGIRVAARVGVRIDAEAGEAS